MDKEILHKTVLQFLNAHPKAIFGIVGEDNAPTTSLMLYVADDACNIYFGTRKAFGKYEAMKENPHVSLTVVEEATDPLKAVEIRGEIEFVPHDETKEKLSFLESKNELHHPQNKHTLHK